MTTKKYFCIAPWVHLHTWPDGTVFPCCNSEITDNLGNLCQSSLGEIWNSEKVIQFRKDLLADKPREDFCKRCYDMEESGSRSLRNQFNNNFKKEFLEQSKHEEVPLRLYYWDFRFSNLCNQACRTCGPVLSSHWYDDFYSQHGQDHHGLSMKFLKFQKDDINRNVIKEHIQYVKEIYFAGGEPTLMEDHKFTLEQLIEHKRYDIKILYSTNLASLVFRGMHFLDIWPRFKEVNICVSLDEIADRAEYWRYGTTWDKFIENIKKVKSLSKICPSVKLTFGITTSMFNSHRLTAISELLINEGILDKTTDLRYNPLVEPKYFDAKNMPNEYKATAVADLNKLKTMPYQPLPLIDAIIYRINLESEDNLRFKAAKELAELDKIRNQSLKVIAPELYDIYKEYGYDDYFTNFKKHERII
jgi:radical SAM protein with 4Fe4S-binding SPASM domain